MERETTRTFVMGDIHGSFAALQECLQLSGFNYEMDTLIQLGDIVDGKDEVFECVEELLKIKNLITIKGNHDVWFMEFLATGRHPRQWRHGAVGTIVSYLRNVEPTGVYFPKGEGFDTTLAPHHVPVHHHQFFQEQRLYYIDNEKRLFVHAGFDTASYFYGQQEEHYYFDRSLWLAAMNGIDPKGYVPCLNSQWSFSEIFIGHTQTINWDSDQPMSAFNITNMDTGAGGKGRLSIMDVDSKEYWQSTPIPELYKHTLLR